MKNITIYAIILVLCTLSACKHHKENNKQGSDYINKQTSFNQKACKTTSLIDEAVKKYQDNFLNQKTKSNKDKVVEELKCLTEKKNMTSEGFYHLLTIILEDMSPKDIQYHIHKQKTFCSWVAQAYSLEYIELYDKFTEIKISEHQAENLYRKCQIFYSALLKLQYKRMYDQLDELRIGADKFLRGDIKTPYYRNMMIRELKLIKEKIIPQFINLEIDECLSDSEKEI